MTKTEAEVTTELGQKMLGGWRMLGSHCPICSTVLLQQKGESSRYCCKCEVFFVTESEAKKQNLTITDTFEDFKKSKNASSTTATIDPTPQPQTPTPTQQQPNPTPPILPKSPRPTLNSSTPAPTTTTSKALVDEDFENDDEEITNETKRATEQAYGDLKAMYAKLMGSSQSFLNSPLSLSPSPFSQQFQVNTSEPDSEDPDTFMENTGDLIKESILKAGAMFAGLDNDLQGGAPALPSHLITHRDITKTSPPDPDDDWEYYNSRDTDNKELKERIDPKAFARAEQEFANRTLQGWIFSSHACPFCEQILLFPPSSSITPEEIQEDVVDRYNQTLEYQPSNEQYQITSPKLNQDDVELDPCEFIRALCTYCGWYCIADDEYIPTLAHECCACAINLAAHDTRPKVNSAFSTKTQVAAPTTTSTTSTTSTSTAPPTDDWSARIQAAISQSIAKQSKGNMDSEMADEEFDFHNFDGLEETKRILESDELKEKTAILNNISKSLSNAMGQGELLLNEYCPDCAVPLVGVISQDEYDRLTKEGNEGARSNQSQGMKLQTDKYATMPKKCVVCKQKWNFEEEDKFVAIGGANANALGKQQPQQQQQQQQPQVKAPQQPARPISKPVIAPQATQPQATTAQFKQQPQQQPPQQQPPQQQIQQQQTFQQQPQQPQQQCHPSSIDAAVSSHLNVLAQTLNSITQRINIYHTQLCNGQIPTDDLITLMTISQNVSNALLASKKCL